MMRTRRTDAIRLLVSARDPAAACQMAALSKAARADPRFALTLVAQPPALQILQASGLSVQQVPPLSTTDAHDAKGRKLLELADDILSTVHPDVVLCGLSSPSEGGIDEALMAQRKTTGIVFQDFWGELNGFFGGMPDLVLVIDHAAATQTRQRHGIQTCVTGSPRHGTYRYFDSYTTRQHVRSTLGMDDKLVFGLLGQPLHAREGYRRTLEVWRHALLEFASPPTVLYRPHPRESTAQQSWTQDWLKASGLKAIFYADGSTEQALAACDVVCSVMSNCAYDAAYLNYFSTRPLVSPVLMLFDAELRSFYEGIVKIQDLPYLSEHLALPVWNAQDLASTLKGAATPPVQQQLWRAAQAALEDASTACDRILEAICSAIG